MRITGLFLLVFVASLMMQSYATAQPQATYKEAKQPRILIVLDGSASMLQTWDNGKSRFAAAAGIIAALMDSVYVLNSSIEFALRVYGHQSPELNDQCYDTRREVMFSKNNAAQMVLRLAAIRPAGAASLAYALREAAGSDLEDENRNEYGMIVITDSREHCGDDVCEAARQQIAGRMYIRPFVICLSSDTALRRQYSCIGTCLQATAGRDVIAGVDTILAAYRPWLAVLRMAAGEKRMVTPMPAINYLPASDTPQRWVPPAIAGFATLALMQNHRMAVNRHGYPPLPALSVAMPVSFSMKEPAKAAGRNVLRFVYAGAAGRPVSEYEAELHILSEPGAALRQRCDKLFPYKRGNYYLEISTLPPLRRNIHLDSGQVTITIEQPGTVQITNNQPIGKVSFFAPLAGRYVRFLDMEINGDPQAQQARLQPGSYELRWNKVDANGKPVETISRFSVSSNRIIEVNLQ